MKARIIFISIVIIGFLFLFLFLLNKRETITDLERAYIIQPIPQTAAEREWRRPQFEKTGIVDNFVPDSPLRFSEDGFIYVVDQGERRVNKIDSEANMIDRFGAGEGRGPGEFTAIRDLFLGADKSLWLHDPANNRITVFNTDDSDDWTTLNLPEAANRVIPVGEEEYWLGSYTSDSQFTRYSLAGDVIGMVNHFVDDPTLWSVVLENFLDKSTTGEIVQVHHNTNTLAKYSSEGEIQFFREPITPPPLPTIIPYYASDDPNRVNTIDFLTWVQVSRVVSVVGDTIHLFIHERDEQSNAFPPEFLPGFVDVYDIEDGNYLYSYRPPGIFTTFGFAVSETHIAGINAETGELGIWQVMEEW